jgi:hypothetical protein
VEIDSPPSREGEGKYMKYFSFPWPPIGAALSIFNVNFLVKDFFFKKDVMKTREIAINPES